jgi:hypothetical protein
VLDAWKEKQGSRLRGNLNLIAPTGIEPVFWP